MAVRAGVQTLENQAAAGFAEIAQPPCDQRNVAFRQRLDDPFLYFRGHQRNVPVKDRRAHWIRRSLDGHAAKGNRLAEVAGLKAGDRHRRRMPHRALLDRLPSLVIRYPSTLRGLLGGQLGQFVSFSDRARIDLTESERLTRGFHPYGSVAVGEIEIDSPDCGARGGVAPEDRRGGDLRWKYRALGGIVDHNHGGSGGGADRFTLRTEAADNRKSHPPGSDPEDA